mmetsp:Transcript_11087/g.29371  ORF Transcript_11087/g.29371 Transcript_11087/m.29371 type:complete len:151 (+) Transcript_11087:212-664(+)
MRVAMCCIFVQQWYFGMTNGVTGKAMFRGTLLPNCVLGLSRACAMSRSKSSSSRSEQAAGVLHERDDSGAEQDLVDLAADSWPPRLDAASATTPARRSRFEAAARARVPRRLAGESRAAARPAIGSAGTTQGEGDGSRKPTACANFGPKP